jgi:RimJ/RimL family protein N-acetyltransferase
MIFSETAHLRIRGYQDSDLDTLVQLFGDPSAQRGDPAMFVPKSETQLKSSLPGVVEKFLMFGVLEIKEAGHDMVGFVGLMGPGPMKNRSASFAIGLVEEHRGKGYGPWYNRTTSPSS